MSLFSEKQKFMCSIFSTTLQTDRGKNFIREHEEDFDAQMVCKNLLGFHTTSVGARVSAYNVLRYITLEKVDP